MEFFLDFDLEFRLFVNSDEECRLYKEYYFSFIPVYIDLVMNIL